MSIQQQESKSVWVLNTHTGTHPVILWTITHSSLTANVVTVRFPLLDYYIPGVEVFDEDGNSYLAITSWFNLKVAFPNGVYKAKLGHNKA